MTIEREAASRGGRLLPHRPQRIGLPKRSDEPIGKCRRAGRIAIDEVAVFARRQPFAHAADVKRNRRHTEDGSLEPDRFGPSWHGSKSPPIHLQRSSPLLSCERGPTFR